MQNDLLITGIKPSANCPAKLLGHEAKDLDDLYSRAETYGVAEGFMVELAKVSNSMKSKNWNVEKKNLSSSMGAKDSLEEPLMKELLVQKTQEKVVGLPR